jgi:hypothetical protein
MIATLKVIGLYPPDSEDKTTQRIYAIYATIFRWIFLHIFAFFQAIFFLRISNIKEVADALFMFMTIISMMYKTEIYFRNRYRFKAIVQRFNSELFLPKTYEEKTWVCLRISGFTGILINFPTAFSENWWSLDLHFTFWMHLPHLSLSQEQRFPRYSRELNWFHLGIQSTISRS